MSFLDWWRKKVIAGDVPDVPGQVTPRPGDAGYEITMWDDVAENKNLIFQIALIGAFKQLTKTKEGHKTIQILGKELIKGVLDTTHALGQASAANAVAAWANPVLISGVLERFGCLPPHFNAGYHAGITMCAGVDVITGVIDSLFGKGGTFPESIKYSSRASSEGGGEAAAKLLPLAAGMPPMV